MFAWTGQRIHRLRAADPRDRLHREARRARLGDRAGSPRRWSAAAETPISTLSGRSRPISSALGGATLTTTSAPNAAAGRRPASRPPPRKAVGDQRAGAGAALHQRPRCPRRRQLATDLGHERHPALALGRLLGDSDLHAAARSVPICDRTRSASRPTNARTSAVRTPSVEPEPVGGRCSPRAAARSDLSPPPGAWRDAVRSARRAGAGAMQAAVVVRGRGRCGPCGGAAACGCGAPALPAAAACPRAPSAPRRSPRRASGRPARVADVPVGGDQRAQVGERRRRAAAVQRASGRRRRRSGPAPPTPSTARSSPRRAGREAAVAVLLAAEVADRARAGVRARPRRVAGQRLERRARVVDVARPPRPAKLKPPSGSCWRSEPGDERAAGGATPAAAQGEHRERGPVDLLCDRPVAAGCRARARRRGRGRRSSSAGRPAARTTRIVRSSEPGSASRAPARDVADQAVPAAGDVRRVLAGRGQAERRPAGVELARTLARAPRRSRRRRSGRRAGSRPAWLAAGARAAAARPAAERPSERDHDASSARRRRRDSHLQPPREALERAHQRRPEREREHQAAGGVDGRSRAPLPT